MRFKAKDIGPGGVDVNVPVTDAWLKTELADLEAKPAQGGLVLKGRLEPSGDDFLFRGTLRGALEATCSRCLEPARIDLDVPVTVCYVEKKADATAEDDDNLDAPDLIPFEEVIDLNEELREELLLALPQSPLCKEDCAGLCAVCGGNRNTIPCDCEEKQRIASSKLGALAKLKI